MGSYRQFPISKVSGWFGGDIEAAGRELTSTERRSIMVSGLETNRAGDGSRGDAWGAPARWTYYRRVGALR